MQPATAPEGVEPTAQPAPEVSSANLNRQARALLTDDADQDQITEGLRLLDEAAAADNSEALFFYGEIYRTGRFGMEADARRAIDYFQRAADAGNATAYARIGNLYRTGAVGLDADPVQAADAFEKAIAAGDSNAAVPYAIILTQRDLPTFNPERAVELLAPLADAGNTGAQTALGELYRRGAGDIAIDAARATSLFTAAAAKGDLSAARNLIDMSIRGEGQPADFEAGIARLEQLAATNDDSGLKVLLGDYYARAEFGHVDAQKALAAYREAADAGNAGALTRIGNLYRTGATGLPADPERAVDAFEQAIAAGQAGAAVPFSLVLTQPGLSTYDPARALELLQPLADSGNAGAQTVLGELLRRGSGPVAADPDRAYALFTRAAAAGDLGAERNLIDMTIRGESRPADFEAGITRLQQLAAERDDSGLLVLLGDYYARSEFGMVDVSRAIGYYQQAAAKNNAGALTRIGNLYRLGAEGLSVDYAQAASYFKRAIAAGDVSAALPYANILTPPTSPTYDPELARDVLTAASEAGNAFAAADLGTLYAAQSPIGPDYDAATAAFERAQTLGFSEAKVRQGVALTSGPLAAEHFDEGVTLLREAVADGVTAARLQLARLQARGAIDGEGIDDAITTIEPAVEAGDVGATRFLIGIYRDGVRGERPRDPEAARSLVRSAAERLGPATAAYEELLVDALQPWGRSSPQSLTTLYSRLNATDKASVVTRLRGGGENAYVLILQYEMAARGYYDGNQNGLLTGGTISAIRRFCDDRGIASACTQGPLSGPAAAAIASQLSQPVQQ